MSQGGNEAFSRVLIDKALEFSGWNLLDPKEVRFEVSLDGQRTDYLLGGLRGPLSVLEAKNEDEDPYDAKEQARGYPPSQGSSCLATPGLDAAAPLGQAANGVRHVVEIRLLETAPAASRQPPTPGEPVPIPVFPRLQRRNLIT